MQAAAASKVGSAYVCRTCQVYAKSEPVKFTILHIAKGFTYVFAYSAYFYTYVIAYSAYCITYSAYRIQVLYSAY